MTKTLRTGIVGTGKIGHFHARSLAALDQSEFVAVAGRRREQAEEFAATYGVRAFTDTAEMVREERLDVVLVCTPHPIHREVALAAMEQGAHVLIEKPLASSLEDADAILEAGRRLGRTVGTIYQRRFLPPALRTKRAIDDGKLGRVAIGNVHILGWRDRAYYESDPWRGSWDREGGGVLINQAPHQLDLLLWYMGEVEEVYGQWRNVNHPYIEVEDTVVATVRFVGGGVATILASNSQNPALFAKVQVHGDNGATISVQTDGGAMFLPGQPAVLEAPHNDIWTVDGEAHLVDGFRRADEEEFARIDDVAHYHRLQIEDFLEAVADGRPPLVTGEDGRATVELIQAIYRSADSGLPVRLPL